MIGILRGLTERAARWPGLFDLARWLLEAGFVGERRVLRRLLPSARGAGRGPVLDLGCGTGTFAPLFREALYVGVDLSYPYLARARRRGGRYVQADAARLPFRDGAFREGFVVGVLHHFDDRLARAALAELARVLAPGAFFAVLEDVPTRRRWNWPGRLVHRLDVGGTIRPPEGYRALFPAQLQVEEEGGFTSGVCDYGYWGGRRRS